MKTNEAKPFRLSGSCRIALGATLGVLIAGACGGVIDRNPITGSESHFLAYCAEGCGPGLDCIGGICTRPCLTGTTSCSDLASNAACTNSSVEPGQVAVCDVTCAGGGGCDALGANYACNQGFCRKDPSHGSTGSVDAGPDGSSTGSGGSSAGGGASSPDAGSRPFCEAAYRDEIPPPDVRQISFTNTGSVALYIARDFLPSCQDHYHPYTLRRDGSPVNIMGPLSCQEAVSCEKVMDEGWPNPAAEDCNNVCAAPSPLVIQPGQTSSDPVALELGRDRLPRDCAHDGNDSADGFNFCNTRIIPQPGNYELTVFASRELQCSSATDCDCRPDASGACTNPFVSLDFSDSRDLKFTFQTNNYFQSQTFQLSAP